jgi:transposase, IS30 family
VIPAYSIGRRPHHLQAHRPVLVLHERKSRVTLAARLTGKTAAETISVMLAVFGRINPSLSTMTRPSPSKPCWGPCAIWRYGFTTPTPLGKKAALKTPMVDYDAGCPPHRHRSNVRRGNPGHRHNRESHPEKMPGLPAPFQAILKELGKDVQIRFS